MARQILVMKGFSKCPLHELQGHFVLYFFLAQYE